jgi:hypothetical protein
MGANLLDVRLVKQSEVAFMARRSKPLTIKVTHRYVHDPEAVERGLQVWAMFLAEHLRKQMLEEARHQEEPKV